MIAMRTLFALSLLSIPAVAQSVNMRLTDHGPVPSASYGAALHQAGAWNSVAVPDGSGPGLLTTPLVALDGAATNATVTSMGCNESACTVAGYGPDVAALFAGAHNGDCYLFTGSTVLNDLRPGSYVLTAYGGQCYGNTSTLGIWLSDLSYQTWVVHGGSYQGSFDTMVLGVCEFDLAAGVEVRLGSSNFNYLSALQMTLIEPPQVYCTAKVNSEGCAAQIAAVGNTASAAGATPFHLVASHVVGGVPGLLLYGFEQDAKPFMGGLLCVEPPALRTGPQPSGGDGTPCSGTFDLDLSAWLANQAATKVYAGTRLYAQYWYRDPADPFGAATSDAVSFHVVP